MITTAAMSVTLYAMAVMGLALLTRLVPRSRAGVRVATARLLAFFGVITMTMTSLLNNVITIAGLYVWLSLGPATDSRLVSSPRVALPEPPLLIDI